MSKPIPVLETRLNGLRVRFRKVPKVLFISPPPPKKRSAVTVYDRRRPTTRDRT